MKRRWICCGLLLGFWLMSPTGAWSQEREKLKDEAPPPQRMLPPVELPPAPVPVAPGCPGCVPFIEKTISVPRMTLMERQEAIAVPRMNVREEVVGRAC